MVFNLKATNHGDSETGDAAREHVRERERDLERVISNETGD
jgi:hypothetical protein